MKYVFLLYLILNPLFFFVNCDQRCAQEVFYQISSIVIFIASFCVSQKAVKFFKLHMWLGIMMLAFIGAYITSMNGFQKIAFNFLLGLMVYFVFIRTISKEDIPFLFNGVAWVGVAGLLYMAFQCLGVDLRGTVNGGSLTRIDAHSFFFQNSAMGMYFAQIIPLIASLNFYLAPLLFIPVLKSQCAGAILGGIIAYLFFLWFKKRIMFWIVLIPCILGVCYVSVNKENSYGLGVRLPIWKETIQDIIQKPIGHGLDNFENGDIKFVQDIDTKKISRFIKDGKGKTSYKIAELVDSGLMKKLKDKTANTQIIDHPHNEYLWLGYEVGLHALVILGFIFYYTIDRFKKSRRDPLTCASLGYVLALSIFCITQFPLHLARIGHMLPVVAGCFYVTTED